MRTTALASHNSARAARPHPLRTRHHIVAPALQIPEAATAAVFAAVRQRGPIARDVIAQVTKLSIATVNRQVTTLLDAGLLRERGDLAVSGAIGRPRVPVEVNHEPYLTLGIHLGARTTSIVATDLFGRTLDAVETPTPRGGQAASLASLAGSARRYLSRWHRRRPLWVGVATGGVVDGSAGVVDHARLGWTQAPVGPVLADQLGLPVEQPRQNPLPLAMHRRCDRTARSIHQIGEVRAPGGDRRQLHHAHARCGRPRSGRPATGERHLRAAGGEGLGQEQRPAQMARAEQALDPEQAAPRPGHDGAASDTAASKRSPPPGSSAWISASSGS